MDNTDNNQRNISQSDIDDATQHSGKNLKGYRPEDQINAVNQMRMEGAQKGQAEATKRDPTLPATLHGNQPHPGARVDKELRDDDEATVRKKDQRKVVA